MGLKKIKKSIKKTIQKPTRLLTKPVEYSFTAGLGKEGLQKTGLLPNAPEAPTISPLDLSEINAAALNDRALIEQLGQQQLEEAKAQSLLSQQERLNALKQYDQSLGSIQPLVEAEAQRQYDQSIGLANQQAAARQLTLNDLGDFLNQRQTQLFNRAIPNIAEQVQTAGLLQSSGFGQALANEQKALTQDTQSQLLNQALADRELMLQAQGEALQNRLALQGTGLSARTGQIADVAQRGLTSQEQTTQELSNLLAQRQGLSQSGLQRQFSLQDYARSAELAQKIGANNVPQVGSGNNVLTGALGGAATGASFGPMGAAIGGAAGLGLGLLSNKKGK